MNENVNGIEPDSANDLPVINLVLQGKGGVG